MGLFSSTLIGITIVKGGARANVVRVEDPARETSPKPEQLPAGQDNVDDPPAIPTEKSRGKKKARDDNAEGAPAEEPEELSCRADGQAGAASSIVEPESVPRMNEEAEPGPTGNRRSARQKKPVDKAVKPLVPPPAKPRAKQVKAAAEPPPLPRPRVQRERPVLLSQRRPDRPFERTVYYSDSE